jgi:LacI family transcriptional regulator
MADRMPPPPLRATVRSIARETGYSVATVSRALNGLESVRPETMQQIVDVANRLGYRRSASAASLRTGRSRVISLLVPLAREGDILGNHGALQLVSGADRRLVRDGWTLSLVPHPPDGDGSAELESVIRQGLCDGVIIEQTRPSDERVRRLADAGFPFVTFGRTQEAVPHPHYDVDNDDFGHRAARFLIESGCRRPLLVAPDGGLSYGIHRRAGFARALNEAGMSYDPARSVLTESGDGDIVKRMLDRLDGPDAPDGICCGNEVATLALIHRLLATGRRIGRDVHLTQVETSDLPDHYPVPVSGFFQDLDLAGWLLADFLLRRIEGAAPETLARVDRMTFRPRG